MASESSNARKIADLEQRYRGRHQERRDHKQEWAERHAPTPESEAAVVPNEALGPNRLNLPGHYLPAVGVCNLLYNRARGDSLIALGSYRPTRAGEHKPHYLTVIPNEERGGWITELWEWQAGQTLYIAPNTLSVAALCCGRTPRDYHDAAQPGRTPLYYEAWDEHARELVALFVDLDVGHPDSKSGLTASQAVAIVVYRVLEGMLPPPSLFAYSGRGAYLLYLLREGDSMAPPLVNSANVHKWRMCIAKLIDETRDLDSDDNPGVKRLLAWLKAPDTTDYKTGSKTVYFTVGLNRPDAVPLYTLTEMAGKLGLPPFIELDASTPPALPPPPGPEPDPRPRAQRRRTGKRRNVQPGKGAEPQRCRAQEIERIASGRGGIPKGRRTFTLLFYFTSQYTYLRNLYRDTPKAYLDARALTFGFNDSYCDPKKPSAAVEKCCPREWSKLRASTIVNHLRVTADEVARHGLVALVPPDMKRARNAEKERARAVKRERQERICEALRRGDRQADIARREGVQRQAVHYHHEKLRAKGLLPATGQRSFADVEDRDGKERKQ